MKYLKMLGLAALAAGALMAFAGAGTASATELDCSPSTMCAAPTRIHAEAEGIVKLDAAIAIECATSTVEGRASTGSSTETPNGEIEVLTFGMCEPWTVTVIRRGTLEVHTDTTSADGNGILTSSGAEVTVEGFGLHCIYGTNNTSIGTVTGSRNRAGSTATLDIKANIPRIGGRSGAFCGGNTAEWTGSYLIDTPDYLDVT